MPVIFLEGLLQGTTYQRAQALGKFVVVSEVVKRLGPMLVNDERHFDFLVSDLGEAVREGAQENGQLGKTRRKRG